jgi:hypothetical protein
MLHEMFELNVLSKFCLSNISCFAGIFCHIQGRSCLHRVNFSTVLV